MRGWLILLSVLVLAEVGLFGLWHRDSDELRAAAAEPVSPASLFALHVLANRDDTEPLDLARVRALLESEHAEVREYAMTWDGTRAAGEQLQRAYLEGLEDEGERARCDFYLRHQILRPTLERLRAYLHHSSVPR